MHIKPILSAVLTLSVSTFAFAQEARPPVSTAWQSDLRAGVGYYFSGDLRGSPAEVEGEFYRVQADLTYARGRDWRVGMGVGALTWEADWSAPVDYGVASEVPFDQVEQMGVSGSGYYRINDRYGVVGFGGISFARGKSSAALDSVSLSKGDTYFLGGALVYQASNELFLSIGVLYSTGLEDSDTVVPILGLRYRYSDNWSVRMFEISGIDNFDILGVDYDPTGEGEWLYSLSVQWANESFLIGRRTDGTGKLVAVEDRAYRLLAGLTWSRDSGLYLQPYAGFDLYRKMKFLSDSETLASHRVRDSWVAGINVGWKF